MTTQSPSHISGPSLEKFCPKIAQLRLGHAATPSWQVGCEGYAQLRATRHTENDAWIQFIVSETSAKGSAKRVHFTLRKDEAEALRKFLNEDASTFPLATVV